jgi:peptide/nickel transport system permease protein
MTNTNEYAEGDDIDRSVVELSKWEKIKNILKDIRSGWDIVKQSTMSIVGLFILAFYTVLAIVAPYIAPYGPDERIVTESGAWISRAPPSLAHPMGTTENAYDVFSQIIIGSRVAVGIGFLGAFIIIFIGTTAGIISGYYGGWVDELITRIMDIMYGLPFIPLVIVLAALYGSSLTNVVIGIAIVYWLTTGRVIRSEVMSLKNRSYIEAARAAGASDFRIMRVHILPNVLPITVLYGALGIGYSIIAESGISFLGFAPEGLVSWGGMLNSMYQQQALDAWWWLIAPGLSIALIVTGAFLLSRGYDEVVNPQLQN